MFQFVEFYTKQREQLLKKRDDVKEKVFNPDKCASCGQELPIDEVEKQRAIFNDNKKNELDNIIKEGKLTADKLSKAKATKEELEAEIAKPLELKERLDITLLNKKLDKAKANISKFEDSEQYKEITTNIANLEDKLIDIPKQDNEELSEKKASLLSKLEELSKVSGKKELLDKAIEDLETLRDKHKSCGVELAKLQRLEMQIKEYIEERARITSDRVNSLLENSFIQMETIQKDGTAKPDCVICGKGGVKYATINTSDRILICVEMQRLFCKFYKIMLPLFLDEVSVIDDDRLPRYDDMQCVYIIRDDCDLTIVKE